MKFYILLMLVHFVLGSLMPHLSLSLNEKKFLLFLSLLVFCSMAYKASINASSQNSRGI